MIYLLPQMNTRPRYPLIRVPCIEMYNGSCLLLRVARSNEQDRNGAVSPLA